MTAQAIALDGIAPVIARAEPTERPARGLSITGRDIGKSFGDHHVLRDLSFDVPAGQFVAIMGRSGCGKSTLLRLLVGLDRPTTGQLSLDDLGGAPPRDNRDARDAVRIMFQEPRLLPWAKVLANVEVGLGPRRSPAGRALALDALGNVGLADRRDEWPSVLSGGQKQRVALARALVSRPRVLAFDEPLGALDALTRIAMQRLLEQVWLEQRFTAVMVTHDVAEAVALADRILVLDGGKVATDITVDLPRPRARGSAEVAAIEERLLGELLG